MSAEVCDRIVCSPALTLELAQQLSDPPLEANGHAGRRATVAGCHGAMSDVGGWLRPCSAIQAVRRRC